MIGIVGGMGPYAGLELVRLVFDLSEADRDDEHLPIALISRPADISSRMAFLRGESEVNPAVMIDQILADLEHIGCTVGAIPCGTAHAAPILDEVRRLMTERRASLRLHTVGQITAELVRVEHPSCRRVGVLGTSMAVAHGVYEHPLGDAGFEVINISPELQDAVVDPAIFHPTYGLKACGSPVNSIARQGLISAIQSLADSGAEVVVMGCTEFPLAIHGDSESAVPVTNPMVAVAKALVASEMLEAAVASQRN